MPLTNQHLSRLATLFRTVAEVLDEAAAPTERKDRPVINSNKALRDLTPMVLEQQPGLTTDELTRILHVNSEGVAFDLMKRRVTVTISAMNKRGEVTGQKIPGQRELRWFNGGLNTSAETQQPG